MGSTATKERWRASGCGISSDFNKITEDLRKITYAGTYSKPIQNRVIRLLEKGLVRSRLSSRFADFHQRVHKQGQDVGQAILEALGISIDIRTGVPTHIPTKGPVIVVGNHPFGIIDGMVAAQVVRRQRDDLKIVAHQGISGLDEFSDYFLPINFDQTQEAKEINTESVSVFKNHLKNGGAGMIFPAGAVSTRLPIWKKNCDPPWHPSVGKWAKDFNCQVVPVFIDGMCSPLFQVVSQFSMTLRLSALLYENTRLIDQTIGIRIGESIDLNHLPQSWEVPRMVEYFREKTYSLAGLQTNGKPLKV